MTADLLWLSVKCAKICRDRSRVWSNTYIFIHILNSFTADRSVVSIYTREGPICQEQGILVNECTHWGEKGVQINVQKNQEF